MKRNQSYCRRRSSRFDARSGNTVMLLCVFLPIAIAICSYSINVVYMELVRTEMQIATDAATRAATRALIVTQDKATAVQAADQMFALNPCGETRIPLNAAKIEFGVSTRSSSVERYAYSTSDQQPNAVRIDGTRSHRIAPLFPTPGVTFDFRPFKSAIGTQTEVDIVLVLDRSGSMAFSVDEVAGNYLPAAAPPGWSFGQPVPPMARWLDAVASVQHFLQLLDISFQSERVGLCTYSSDVKSDLPLTSTTAEIVAVLNQYSFQFDGGATNISDAILAGVTTVSNNKSSRPWATRVMILLTDGIATAGTDPAVAARLAASQGINIYTITFSNEADQVKMQEVASIGKGHHYHALSAGDLAVAFKDITTRLPILITE